MPRAAAGPRPRSRGVLWKAAAPVVVVGVVVGLVILRGSGDGKDDGGAGRPPARVTPTSTLTDGAAAPSATEPPSAPAPASPALPAGYRRVVDDEGFAVAVPEGWARQVVSDGPAGEFQIDYGGSGYDDFGVGSFLRVSTVSEPDSEQSFDKARSLDGFQELAAPQPLDGEGPAGYRMEFSATWHEGAVLWYVVEIHFRASDGNLYSVAAAGREDDDLTDERELAGTALTFFCPPGGTCGDATVPQ
ncbi:hypothetical protein [Streptomyces sp. NPDC020983]|uniref:hypothetical protein n=1 Tax=Streptomyces sp. NPDC020983 TaxID=3365106 RepID=UPI00379F0C22